MYRSSTTEQQALTQFTHLRDFSAHTCSAVYSSVASQSPGKVWLLYGASSPMGGAMAASLHCVSKSLLHLQQRVSCILCGLRDTPVPWLLFLFCRRCTDKEKARSCLTGSEPAPGTDLFDLISERLSPEQAIGTRTFTVVKLCSSQSTIARTPTRDEKSLEPVSSVCVYSSCGR